MENYQVSVEVSPETGSIVIHRRALMPTHILVDELHRIGVAQDCLISLQVDDLSTEIEKLQSLESTFGRLDLIGREHAQELGCRLNSDLLESSASL